MNVSKTSRPEDEEHVASDREIRAWQAGKNRSYKRATPELSQRQIAELFKLVAQLSSPTTIERKLGLTIGDVDHYKKKFDIESGDDARRMARKIDLFENEAQETRVAQENARAKEASEAANKRLQDYEDLPTPELVKQDANKVHAEDAERQRRWDREKNADIEAPSIVWHLELSGDESIRANQIDRFRRDITQRGVQFCITKYDISIQQLRFEAQNLKIKVNWDLVRR